MLTVEMLRNAVKKLNDNNVPGPVPEELNKALLSLSAEERLLLASARFHGLL
jgi:hypothetical protein